VRVQRVLLAVVHQRHARAPGRQHHLVLRRLRRRRRCAAAPLLLAADAARRVAGEDHLQPAAQA
jgi:hypothetical protein